MNPPFFTVLVPAYNHERYVGAALDSLLAQTCPDWEAVVVNDGSTDGTGAAVEAYARRDPRIRVFHKANGGVSTALNRGLAEARGQWICWLSSDDLFEPDKLGIHRRWILREPACRFFFTHFRILDDATGIVEEPDLWMPLPDRRTQLARLLRGNYINGISVCFRADAVTEAGTFADDLRVSQDYDMWFRLLAVAPAVFIPERTCITRVHRGRDSTTQEERCFIEGAVACVRLLNRCALDRLFPLLNLDDSDELRLALEEVLDTAASPHSRLYSLGPHLGLIHRAAERVWSPGRMESTAALRTYFRARARTAARSYRRDALGHVWKVATLAATMSTSRPYAPVDPVDLAWSERSRRRHAGRDTAALDAYLARTDAGRTPLAVEWACVPDEVVVLAHPGARVDSPIWCGASRMTLQMTRALGRAGSNVVLMGLSPHSMGTVEGVPFLGAGDAVALRRLVEAWNPRDTVIATSRADAARWCMPRKFIVDHHGVSFPPGGVTSRQMNLLGIGMLCESQFARRRMIACGLRAENVFSVTNCYDARMFCSRGGSPRDPLRLLHVGNPCFGKGTDVVLRAFQRIRTECSRATLDVYGLSAPPWEPSQRGLLGVDWVRQDGALDWAAIERALPGVHYRGAVCGDVVVDAMSSGGLMLLPSREEDVPLAVIEAQVCGCLPVLSRVGGNGEVAEDGVTGFLLSDCTADSVADLVLSLWRRGEPTEEQRRVCARRAAVRHEWSAVFKAFMEAVGQSRDTVGWRWMAWRLPARLRQLCLRLRWQSGGTASSDALADSARANRVPSRQRSAHGRIRGRVLETNEPIADGRPGDVA